MKNFSLFILLIIVLSTACRPSIPVQKPKGYYRIELPRKSYQKFDSAGFPFSFEYPTYARITRDQQIDQQNQHPYWINVFMPQYDATIYISYKAIDGATTMDRLVDESFRLSYAHDKKADYIEHPEFTTPKGYKGIFYTVGGDAASAYQFFVTDEQHHYLRGSLYFNTTPNADSLAPLYQFFKEDMDHMIETLTFR